MNLIAATSGFKLQGGKGSPPLFLLSWDGSGAPDRCDDATWAMQAAPWAADGAAALGGCQRGALHKEGFLPMFPASSPRRKDEVRRLWEQQFEFPVRRCGRQLDCPWMLAWWCRWSTMGWRSMSGGSRPLGKTTVWTLCRWRPQCMWSLGLWRCWWL